MRINGFEQIKAFYSWTFDNQDKQIKPQHISLYLFLLNQNNRANWVEYFKCPYDLAMTGSCIGSKKTYYNCLNDLQEWRLIEYKKGSNNWKAPVIKLEVLKCTSTVPLSEPLPTQVPTQVPIQLPTHKYKLITDNIKLVNDNIEKWIKDSLDDKPKKDSKLRLQQFDLWWSKYPSGANKKGAKEKWLKLKDEEITKILKTIDSFVKYKPFETYTHPNPCTYLNQRRWEDELPTTPQSQVADDLKPFLDIVNNDPKYKYKTDSQKVFEAGVLKALSQNS